MKIIIIHLLIALAICSCSSRKTETNKKKESLKTDNSLNSENSKNSIIDLKEELNIKSVLTTKIDTKNKTITNINIWEPIKPDIEASVIDEKGNKIILNNARKIETTKTEETKTKTDNSDNSEEFRKAELKYQKEQKTKITAKNKAAVDIQELTKESDREGFSFFNWIWFLIVILIFIFWKNRTKIFTWIKNIWV
jgi:hypothetical protein